MELAVVLNRNPEGHLESLREAADGESIRKNLSQYYPETSEGSFEVNEPYYGRKVIWSGIEGRMLKVKPEYVVPTFGNIWNFQQLAVTADAIETAADRLSFEAPYGDAQKIDLRNIKESLEDKDIPETCKLTTGDDELDQFLLDPKVVMEDYADPDEDPEKYQETMEAFKEQLADAVKNNEGDLGEWLVTLRDGNHRAFAALLAGERYIYVKLTKNQLAEYRRLADEPDCAELLQLLE